MDEGLVAGSGFRVSNKAVAATDLMLVGRRISIDVLRHQLRKQNIGNYDGFIVVNSL